MKPKKFKVGTIVKLIEYSNPERDRFFHDYFNKYALKITQFVGKSTIYKNSNRYYVKVVRINEESTSSIDNFHVYDFEIEKYKNFNETMYILSLL